MEMAFPRSESSETEYGTLITMEMAYGMVAGPAEI